MIRRLCLTLVLALATIAAGANLSGARADIQDFTVVNQGSNAIWYIQVRANYEQGWPKDVLGDDVLMPGNQVDILMSGYGNLVDVPSTEAPALDRIEPGDPDASYLWHKINGTHASVGGSGNPMPAPAGGLDAGTIATIEAWISGGAQP